MTDSGSGLVQVYDVRDGAGEPLAQLPSLHAVPVTALRYSEAAGCVISSDAKG